jgi:hypothetical protein
MLLLIMWGFGAVGIGLLAFFFVVVVDEAWRKISLGRSYTDD